MFTFFRISVVMVLFYLPNAVSSCFGQNSSFRFKVGYGTYAMASLKNLQQSTLSEFLVPAKVVQSFPAYWNAQLKYSYKISPKNRVGVFCELASTGGRVAYSDYSGEIKIDEIVSRYSAGISGEYLLLERKAFALAAILEISSIFSDLTLKSRARINEQTSTDRASFTSLGIGVEPSLQAQYTISRLVVGLHIGYQFSFCKPFHLAGNKYAILTSNNTQEPVKPDWSGIRLGTTVGINF